MNKGTRVLYTPKGEWPYDGYAGKTATVEYTDKDKQWIYVRFLRPSGGDVVLPCLAEELEEVR